MRGLHLFIILKGKQDDVERCTRIMPENAYCPGNTAKKPQRIPLNDLRETLTGILVDIDSDTCHIL